MGALKTAMKTIVTHSSVAIAIAGLLMQHGWNLGRQFISVGLKRVLSVLAPELFSAQDGRRLGALGGRSRIVFWYGPILLGYGPGSGNYNDKQA
jgi:hypothetical protein